MPKLGAVHPDDSDFVFVSLKGGELMYKGPQGRVLSAAEVSARPKPGDDAPDEEDAVEEAEEASEEE